MATDDIVEETPPCDMADFFPSVSDRVRNSVDDVGTTAFLDFGAVDAYTNMPKTTSSAMPDLASPNLPRLQARVHQRLSAQQCASIPISALSFRPLQAYDFDEMVALHTEWFPVNYDESFYQKSVGGELVSLVATYRSKTLWDDFGGDAEEDILGIITMSTSCDHHRDDIANVLGADCSTACHSAGCNVWTPLAAPSGQCACGGGVGSLAYILTLGVADGFRRRGLARELLRRAIAYIQGYFPQVQAVYLHVVTYNEAAIHLYESENFLRIQHFPDFYNLHGQPYDSFLYALYLSSEQMSWWRFHLRNLLSSGVSPRTAHGCVNTPVAEQVGTDTPYAPCRTPF